MFLIFLGLSVGYLFWDYTQHRNKYFYSFAESVFRYLVVIAFIFCLILVLFIGTMFHYETHPDKTELRKSKTIQIESFNNTDLLSGNFFLFGGNMQEDLVYRYVVKNGTGFSIKEIKNDNIERIEYSDNPRIEVYGRYPEDGLFKNIAITSKRIIYVPKGTIKSNFNIDLE